MTKFVIGDKEKSYQLEKELGIIVGKKIGDKFNGDVIGLNGYVLEITGGSDKDGFPMRKDIEGIGRKKIIVTRGVGYKAEKGRRKRKSLGGNAITQDIAQINCKVLQQGEKKLEELFPKAEKKEEKK
jgi:small subunit ribosomal protein S6e